MATNATIHKLQLNIADMDAHYYNEHSLTVAKHPSENNLRLMVRIIAFILNADDELLLCKGISQDDEPDLWKKSLGGDIELWIDLGQPDEKRIKKACGRSDKVKIYTYQEGSASSWFKQNQKAIKRFKNLEVIFLNITGNIEELAHRSINLQCNTMDGELTLIQDEKNVIITQDVWTNL